MSINYPTSLDTFSNPTSTDLMENALAGLDHDVQHSNANDAIEALEAKVGIDGSAVTTSFDYKLGEVTSTDKAVGKTATQTLTNKTLSTGTKITVGSDATGDIYYRNSSGELTRLPIGTANYALSSNGTIPVWTSSATVTGNEKDALAGDNTDITVGASNKYVTQTGLQKSAECYAASATGNDTYVVTLSPVPTSLSNGMTIRVKFDVANTGASTLNVNSLGALSIVTGLSTPTATGDIVANMIGELIYNSTGTVWQLINPASVALGGVTHTNGTTTKNAADASTTQTIAHGLGKTPKKVKLTALKNAAGSSVNDVNSFIATTAYNGTTQSSVSIYGDNSSPYAITAATFSLNTAVASGDQTGVLTFDSTNITITWTKAGSPTGTYTILWEAEA